MSPEEHSEFWRKVQFTVDKDVVRTDRSNMFFRGENNPNVEIMRSESHTLSLLHCIFIFLHPDQHLIFILTNKIILPSYCFPRVK